MRAAMLLVLLVAPVWAAPGDLDPAFGGGTVQHDFGGESDLPEAMTALADGGFAVVGSTVGDTGQVFAVARYTAEGALDPTFGNGGIVETPFADLAVAYGVAEQADGKLVVVGKGGNFVEGDFLIVRYLANGELDPMFGGGDGIVTFDLATNDDQARAVIVEPGGTLLVVGWSLDAGFKEVFTLIRLDGEGDLVNSWGGDGIVTADFTNGAKAFAAVRRSSDGAIVAAGRTSGNDVAVARFESDGDPDTTFSDDGFVTADFGGVDGAVAVMLDGTDVVAVGDTLASGETDLLVARWSSAGVPDNSFSGDGRTTIDIGPNVTARGGAVLADGSVVALGRSSVALQLVLVRFEPDGDPDPTFGDGGVLASFRFTMPAGVVAESDGLVVATQFLAGGGNGDFALARFDDAGELDRAFGDHGRFLLPLSGNGPDSANAIAVQPDGKIVAVGSFAGIDVLIARFDVDGALDSTFGGGDGFVTYDFGGSEALTDVELLPGGGILATGVVDGAIVVVQLEDDGDLDPAFASGTGRVTAGLGATAAGLALARQSDGKIVVAGARDTGLSADVVIARFSATGVLDGDFGTGGFRTFDFSSSHDAATSVVIQPDGKIVAAGVAVKGDVSDAAIVRVDDGGTPDAGFGSGGKLAIDFGGGENDRAYALVRQPSGRLVIAGHAGTLPNLTFALAGITTGGQLDATFGVAGRTVTPFPSGESFAQALAIMPDGRLVAGGSGDDANDVPGFALARYTEDGILDDSFGDAGLVVSPFSGVDMILTSLVVAPDGTLVGSGQGFYQSSVSALALARWEVEGGVPGSTTTTTTVITGSTTTTTMPLLIELCGNCIDDDGDGLTDFEDDGCCAARPSFALKRALMKPAGSVSKLTLKGTLGAGTVDPVAPALALQIRPDGGEELLCARIPVSSLTVKGKAIRFVDKTGTVAAGLKKLTLKRKKDGSLSLAVSAKRAAFTTPEAGPIMLTVGGGDGSEPGQCASVMATFSAKKKGTLKAP